MGIKDDAVGVLILVGLGLLLYKSSGPILTSTKSSVNRWLKQSADDFWGAPAPWKPINYQSRRLI